MSTSSTGRTLMRGARPASRHKLGASFPYHIRGTTPQQVIVIPPFLEMWLNDQYGDCVTAEEAFAKAFYSVMLGQPETKIADATVLTFCNKYDFLNGADLPTVMDAMINDGFQQGGVTYKDGPYNSVDWSKETILQNAIAQGPVKIGIDANALPQDAGNMNGWFASGGSPGEFNNEDHCVALCGYGSSSALFAALGATMPSGFPAQAYLLYTWSTIGVVDHAWIMSTCGEAWIRNPTTPGLGPVPPPPVPPVPPPPPPPPGPGPMPGGNMLMLATALAPGNYAIGTPSVVTVQSVRSLFTADALAKLDAAGFNWQVLIQIIMALLALLQPPATRR